MKTKLYGAILGDIAGQPYEYYNTETLDTFDIHKVSSHITDDTLMTLASADAILHDKPFAQTYKEWYCNYDDDKFGYGSNFKNWCLELPEAFTHSYGNGCLMRLSPVLYADRSFLESIQCTHDHTDSYYACLCLKGTYTYRHFIPCGFKNSESLRGFKINAIDTLNIVHLHYNGIESTQELIQNIINFGGDTDTNASIIGELSAYLKNDLTPDDIEFVRSKLDKHQLTILDKFNEKF